MIKITHQIARKVKYEKYNGAKEVLEEQINQNRQYSSFNAIM